ncbi:MAG: hypothetical protein IJ848_00565 [Alphaproteobacteria bacterium]|nr:hypothetical protein [Alphaproteobacteria bacterium]
MDLNKIFSIVVMLCLLFSNKANTGVLLSICTKTDASNIASNNSPDISMNFRKDGSFFIKRGTTEKLFSSVNKLSDELNSITGEYFCVSSVELDNKDNNIVFNNVYNTKPCNITFSSSDEFKPGVVLSFGDNSANFQTFTLEKEISRLGFNYNIPNTVTIKHFVHLASSTDVINCNQPLILRSFNITGRLNAGADGKIAFA